MAIHNILLHLSGNASRCSEVLVDQGVGISAMGGSRSLRVGDLGVAWLQSLEFRKGDFA